MKLKFCRLPNKTINAGEIWLIVNTDPNADGVNLASGTNLSDGALTLKGKGETKYLVVSTFKIPAAMNANSFLILRGHKGYDSWNSRRNLHDLVGSISNTGNPHWTRNSASPAKEPHSGNQIWDTKIFPLNGQNPPNHAGNNANSLLSQGINFAEGKAWARSGNNKGWLRDGGRHAGFKGGIGYDRAVMRSANPNGTPGYPNDAYQNRGGAVTNNVRITEIMLAQTGVRNVIAPQWIEIKNQSSSVSVDLHNVGLTIINHDTTYAADGTATANWDGKGEAFIRLNNLYLRPLETVLIASSLARQQQVRVPADRILNLFQDGHKGTFGMTDAGDPVINPYGFLITLHTRHNEAAQHWELIDQVGNLGEGTTDRRGNTRRFDDPEWSWMEDVGVDIDDNNVRSSYVRTNTITDTTPDDLMDNMFSRTTGNGRMAAGWILASMDARTDTTLRGFDQGLITANNEYKVYYGFSTDIGTPGQTDAQPLPVELSFFRPTSENGKVTIQWTTESELDNAGFNILRSDTRNGEFTQVNEQMIQGKGTTAERSTYKWVDTTAKPGAIYYYQIEDVSFAGEHNTLATTKLKGLISAKGKLTTSWGDIKNASQ